MLVHHYDAVVRSPLLMAQSNGEPQFECFQFIHRYKAAPELPPTLSGSSHFFIQLCCYLFSPFRCSTIQVTALTKFELILFASFMILFSFSYAMFDSLQARIMRDRQKYSEHYER